MNFLPVVGSRWAELFVVVTAVMETQSSLME